MISTRSVYLLIRKSLTPEYALILFPLLRNPSRKPNDDYLMVLVGLPGGDKQLTRSLSMAATNWAVVNTPVSRKINKFLRDSGSIRVKSTSDA